MKPFKLSFIFGFLFLFAPIINTIRINSTGSPELITKYANLDFDPSVKTLYYAHVIEITTPCRTYDAKKYDTKMHQEPPMITQERAYISPIWYSLNQKLFS